MSRKVPFIVAALGRNVDPFMLHVRTKAALAAAKARGQRLGNPKQAEANKREADAYAKTLKPVLVELRHMLVERIADELRKRKIATRRGGDWSGRTVARLRDGLGLR